MKSFKMYFLLILIVTLSCRESGISERVKLTKKMRNYKLTAVEFKEIKNLIENKKKLNLGILLKVKSANLDADDDPERVVAYRKDGVEQIAVLDLDKNSEYNLLKPKNVSFTGWQIVTFDLESVTSKLYDSIVIQIRPKSIRRLSEVYYRVLNKMGNYLGLILDSDALIRQGRLSQDLPLNILGKYEQTFANDVKTSQVNFILTAKILTSDGSSKEINKYYFFNGRSFMLKKDLAIDSFENEETTVQAKVIQPKVIYRVKKNTAVQKKMKSSCQLIFDQVLKQCNSEVESEDIDPDTDCMNKATSAKLTCYQG